MVRLRAGVTAATALRPKLPVPLERSERCGPERCSGTFRTVAPAAARYVLTKNKFISNETPHYAAPGQTLYSRKGKATKPPTKLLVRVVLFSARSLPRAPTLNPREADNVKNAPRRGSSSPSCPASASTRAMIQHGPCPLARTGPIGQDTSQLHRHEQTAARLGVPRCAAGEDEKEEGREAVAAVRDQLRLQSDSPV